MNYFIYQGNDNDCGFACLKMLLAHYAHDRSYLCIEKKKKKENFSMQDLIDIGKEYNVTLECFRCNKAYLNELECPFIAIINSNHAVLVTRITKKKVYLNDPGVGKVSYKLDDFLNVWTGTILEVDDASAIEKIAKKRYNILPPKMSLTHACASLLSAAVLMSTFYVLNNAKNTVLSFVFLFIFIISQFIENLCIKKQLNYFDKHYIPLYFSTQKNCTQERYYKFINFKNNFFSSSRNAIVSFLLAFMSVILLAENDFRSVFAVLILVLLKVLENTLFNQKKNQTIEKVDQLEKKAFNDKKATIDILLEANNVSSKAAFTIGIKNLVFLAICFLLSLSMMFLTGNKGCDYVIFHFVMYFVAYKSISDVINHFSFNTDRIKDEIRFFDDCNL